MAVKLGYLGDGFHGYQRQPGKRTVEGCLIEALEETGLIADVKASRFSSAGRTDRGVNALGQVVSFDLEGTGKAACRRLNSMLPGDVFAWGQTAVPDTFDPRRGAISRAYTYLLRGKDIDPGEIRMHTDLFTGTHDFSQFSRPSERNNKRSVDEIEVVDGDPIILVFRARSFLWMQVRKMVTGLTSLARGELEPGEVSNALRGKRLAVAPAPAENLILFDIDYPGVDFEVDGACVCSAKEFLNESISRLEAGISVRRKIMGGLLENAPVA